LNFKISKLGSGWVVLKFLKFNSPTGVIFATDVNYGRFFGSVKFCKYIFIVALVKI
jgi:hypothetical protein